MGSLWDEHRIFVDLSRQGNNTKYSYLRKIARKIFISICRIYFQCCFVIFSAAGVDFRSLQVQSAVTAASPRLCADVEIIDDVVETGDTPIRFSVIITTITMTGNVQVTTTPFQIDIQDDDSKQF